jgi:hypothetical protein
MRMKPLTLLLIAGVLIAACGAPAPAPSPAPVEPSPTMPLPGTTRSTPAAEPTLAATPGTADTSAITEVLTTSLGLPPQTGAPAPLTPLGASPAFLSSRGQLAYIQDGVLMVESAAQSGAFTEIARYATYARWSPDGSRLLFDTNPELISYSGEAGIYLLDYKLWHAADGLVTSLTALEGFPPPPYLAGAWIPLFQPNPAAFQSTWIPGDLAQGQTVWSPDGNLIYFINIVEPERLPVSFPGSNTVVVADLAAGRSFLAAEAVLISRVLPLPGEAFILQDHCGELCEWLTAYNLQGRELWHLPWVTDGAYAVTDDGAALINAGRITYDQPTETNTVDRIDTGGGDYHPIWTLAPDEYFMPSNLYQTGLSADGSLVSFNLFRGEALFLQAADLQGKSYGQMPDAVNLGWQPGNGLMALQLVRGGDAGQVQLVYWHPPSGGSITVFGPTAFVPVDGAWSQDGAHFAFCTFDPVSATQSVYLWSPADPTVQEVQTAPAGQAVHCNPTWLGDSSRLFFNLVDGPANAATGRLVSSLWQYTLANGLAAQISANP